MQVFSNKPRSEAAMKPWTIQVTWTERDDDGKTFRARTVFQTMAPDLPTAYKQAEQVRELKPTAVFGACVQAHVDRLP